MAFHGVNIIAIKQPVYLLPGECHDLVSRLWPFEFFLFKTLVIEHKAVVLPEQTFDFISAFVGEGVEVTGKGVVTQLALNNGR